jgi:hypothetical protein
MVRENCLPGPARCTNYPSSKCGGIAQLVERLVRNEKVWGSNPHTSTSVQGCAALSEVVDHQGLIGKTPVGDQK